MGTPREHSAPETLTELLAWLAAAPPGTMLDAGALRATLATIAPPDVSTVAPRDDQGTVGTWRERLWVVPPDTRLGVREVAEALGRPVSWCYRHTSAKSGKALLPHRRLDGELIFVAGELRTWLAQHEESIVAPRPTLALHGRAS